MSPAKLALRTGVLCASMLGVSEVPARSHDPLAANRSVLAFTGGGLTALEGILLGPSPSRMLAGYGDRTAVVSQPGQNAKPHTTPSLVASVQSTDYAVLQAQGPPEAIGRDTHVMQTLQCSAKSGKRASWGEPVHAVQCRVRLKIGEGETPRP